MQTNTHASDYDYRDDPNVQLPAVETDRHAPSMSFLQGRVVELRRCVKKLDERIVAVTDVLPINGLSEDMWHVREALKAVEREAETREL